jgi:glycosyltransferase involved in cell wall biosynthesis
MMNFVRGFFFRAATSLYRRLERRAEKRWSPEDRILLARFMLLIKKRLFSEQGSNSLEARIDREFYSSRQSVSEFKFVAASPIINTVDNVECQEVRTLIEPDPINVSQSSDNFFNKMLCRAVPTSRNHTWLWLEQQQLNQITRHTRLSEADWNRRVEVMHGGDGGMRPETREQFLMIGEGRVRTVLLLPWLRRGGADKAALSYLTALQQEMPGRVLVIFTEPVESSWGHLVPAGVERIDWHKVADWGSIEVSARNLAWLLVRLRPHTIHVMNSFLGWELLKRQGSWLRANSKIFTSLFWYGPSFGQKIQGYASEYLPDLANFIDGVITDNRSFPDKLCREYGFDRSLFRCVYHPTDPIVESSAVSARKVERLSVLWASRFAQEKQMGVLAAVAAARPQHRFLVFGAADEFSGDVFDSIENLKSLENVEMRGPFDGFSALPTSECDVFLYTSSSDGMPNVLLEAAAHGLPILAPAVGGIPELIEDGAGWLIGSSSNVDEYLTALDQAVSNEARLTKALAALDRVRTRHSVEAFQKSLRSVPGYFRR